MKKSMNRRLQRECKSWSERRIELYDEAKARHAGASLTIYEEVGQILNYLEEVEDIPAEFDLFQECDNLACRLRRA